MHLCHELALAIPVRELQVFCIQIFVLLNVVAFAAIVLLTRLAFAGPERVTVLGWLCVGFSVRLCGSIEHHLAQMVVYIVYKNKKKKDAEVAAVPEHGIKIAELSSVPASELQVSLKEKDQNKRSMEDTDKKGCGR
ncbi:hypothetical protein BHE74_00006308 [Ensete ventricosum]|nr:hypothetical protein GW17_00050765 [Ensete ventricosum]RWW85050.1 hypothetical protein BHE74_00006308 [Ensete ventricosum]